MLITAILIALEAFAYHWRGGISWMPLPSFMGQIIPRMFVWGGSMALSYSLVHGFHIKLAPTAWLMLAGWFMMFIPHRFAMTAGTDKSPPQIIKPNLADRWPGVFFPKPSQTEWDVWPQWKRCALTCGMMAVVVALRSGLTFAALVALGGAAPLNVLLPFAIIVALCPIACIIGFRVMNKFTILNPTAWQEVFHGAAWGLAFSLLT